jgi:hypothetical protein
MASTDPSSPSLSSYLWSFVVPVSYNDAPEEKDTKSDEKDKPADDKKEDSDKKDEGDKKEGKSKEGEEAKEEPEEDEPEDVRLLSLLEIKQKLISAPKKFKPAIPRSPRRLRSIKTLRWVY